MWRTHCCVPRRHSCPSAASTLGQTLLKLRVTIPCGNCEVEEVSILTNNKCAHYRPHISQFGVCGFSKAVSLNDDVIGLMPGVGDGSENVLSLKKRIIFQNFFERRPGAKKFEHIRHARAKASNAGTTPALTFFNCDPLEARQIHIVITTIPAPAGLEFQP